MKKFLVGLSLMACGAAATAAVNCIAFTNFCDAMQYDSGFKATWKSYDCAGSSGKQTKATFCDGAAGCNPAAAYGFDSLSWTFNKTAGTGTLVGVVAGSPVTLQQDTPISVTPGACAVNVGNGSGVSSLSR
jgi:hypothetical protein